MSLLQVASRHAISNNIVHQPDKICIGVVISVNRQRITHFKITGSVTRITQSPTKHEELCTELMVADLLLLAEYRSAGLVTPYGRCWRTSNTLFRGLPILFFWWGIVLSGDYQGPGVFLLSTADPQKVCGNLELYRSAASSRSSWFIFTWTDLKENKILCWCGQEMLYDTLRGVNKEVESFRTATISGWEQIWTEVQAQWQN